MAVLLLAPFGGVVLGLGLAFAGPLVYAVASWLRWRARHG
jgi:hypothetical protein